MNTPLWNSIRSFWTPEKSTNPEFLRAVREDKIATAVLLASVAVFVVIALVYGIALCLLLVSLL